MSKLGDALRASGFINTYDLLRRFGEKGKDVAVTYYPRQSRSVRPPKSSVWSPSFAVEPKEKDFQDRGQMSFYGTRKTSMNEAILWASNRFGIAEWVPCPMIQQDKVPKAVVDRARAYLSGKKS